MSAGLTLDRGTRPSLEDALSVVSRARRSGRARAFRVSIVLLALTAAVFAISVSLGDFPIPLGDVFPAIFGFGDPSADFIVQTLRLPRALTGLLVGIGFGMSGAIFQTLVRNPLASPDILGITSGASLAAVFVITKGADAYVDVGGSGRASVLAISAFVGALITATLMYVLAYRHGVSTYRLILIGIGVGAMALAGTEFLLSRATTAEAASSLVWLTGSLNARVWEQVIPLAVSLALLVPAAFTLDRRLRMLQLGDDAAKGLGVRVEHTRLYLMLVGVGLAGTAVAAAGPVAFVALLAPPVARRLARSPGPALVVSGVAGALLVLVADLIGRNLFSSTEIPVGVITGAIGAPYLLWLLARANRIGRTG